MGPFESQRMRPGGLDGDAPESAGATGRSGGTSPRRRYDESWVEVASQPSSSSLSSIGDEIVTTGLRVGTNSYLSRRRRSQQNRPMPASFVVGHPSTHAGATSSQEEYDETESEEDRVISSSTEAIHPSTNLLRQQTAVRRTIDIDTDSDDDENATALGRPSDAPAFRPQPNAFSHPPSHLTHRHSTSSVPPHHPSQSRPPIPPRSHARTTRGHRGFMSPSSQADHDAALRASLTTLLSCAQAARGLGKADERRPGPPNTGMGGLGAGVGVLPSSQPMELRLVPESELMAEGPPPPSAGGAGGPPKAPLRTASNSSAPSAPCSTSSRGKEESTEKSKRAATNQTRSSRAAKKKKTNTAGLVDGETATFLSPTLMTWVVSAGMVVLVSVVGFGAGYVIGREVGRQEGSALGSFGAAGPATNASSCGRELVKSTSGGTLRRFRWGSIGSGVTA
ncbi:hypothetical protein QBC40DRAFT_197661 [Triangularia verruculosa]|uniref:Uncharacterized protein n=1 Tax=Triangularia verruculosa TaxID=2587418 RepID=A0AAN6XK74_9PEZI|nr:hypothetical protein QBC40DRAFT_197661 [Triangularia verruculosa]